MQPYTACLQINRIKILICGDKRVGKTSLIHAFRDDHFTENVQETGEMVCRMRYVQDRRVLFQMVELHAGRLLPPDASNAHAIMLLFDDESASSIKRIKEYWYSKINLYFSHVPLFLVRTKCDLMTSFNTEGGERLKNALHAMRYLECSAKQMNGVKFVFFETLSALKRKPDKEPNDDDFNISMSPLQGVAAVLSRLGSSGPLLKQVAVNVRECLTNPAAFPNVKESIDSYLPFSLFGTTPAPPSNSAANRDSLYNALDLDGTQCDRTAKANTPQRFTRSDRTEQKYVPQRDNRPVDEDDVSRNEESPTSVVSTTSTKSSKSAERPSSAEKSSEHGQLSQFMPCFQTGQLVFTCL